MSRLPCRGSIARAAVLVALFWSSPAGAQVVVVPSPRDPLCPPNPWFTGVQYDLVNQALAERRLQKLQAKLWRDGERGDSAAVDCDARRINNVKYRIAVDEWLIRQNSLQNPGCYPLRIDTMSWAAIAQAARPSPVPYLSWPVPIPGPMAPAPTISITIVNAEPAGAGVTFAINGVEHQAAAGSRQELAVAPDSNITYDGGGSLGRRRFRISPGLYEFRSTSEGWALYKLPDMP